jgi:two-component system cell cycle response regulator DivK
MNEVAAPVILLVEDDEFSRKLVRTVLGKKGYEIRETDAVEAARSMLSQLRPAAVLLDIRLKDGSGLDLARYIRAEPRLSRVPILAITAQALKGDEQRILEAGCDSYLSKPIDTRALPRVVGEIIRKGR